MLNACITSANSWRLRNRLRHSKSLQNLTAQSHHSPIQQAKLEATHARARLAIAGRSHAEAMERFAGHGNAPGTLEDLLATVRQEGTFVVSRK